MEDFKGKSGIKSWAPDDRPREKLGKRGKKALSDAELLAILIGSGTKSRSALDVGRSILALVNNDLNELGRLDIRQLTKVDGIGEARAVSIIAALELGGRRDVAEVRRRRSVTSSRDTFDYFKPKLGDAQYEEFWILMLNRANKVIGESRISDGGVGGTIADPKKIFKIALDNSASGIILCHNHPSGSLTPSAADIDLTYKVRESGKLLDIRVLDHVIVADSGYYSFADEGKM